VLPPELDELPPELDEPLPELDELPPELEELPPELEDPVHHPVTTGSHPCPQVSDDAHPRAGSWQAKPAPPSGYLHPYRFQFDWQHDAPPELDPPPELDVLPLEPLPLPLPPPEEPAPDDE
jgi:hypothetical protein